MLIILLDDGLPVELQANLNSLAGLSVSISLFFHLPISLSLYQYVNLLVYQSINLLIR